MSANFIVEYAGAPVRFTADGKFVLVEHDKQAEPFTSEGEAWGKWPRSRVDREWIESGSRVAGDEPERELHARKLPARTVTENVLARAERATVEAIDLNDWL